MSRLYPRDATGLGIIEGYDKALASLPPWGDGISVPYECDFTCAKSLTRAPACISEIDPLGDEDAHPRVVEVKQAYIKFLEDHGVDNCSTDNIEISTSIFMLLMAIFSNREFMPEDSKILMTTPTFGYYLTLLSDAARDDDF